MPERILVPSIENRLAALIEISRRKEKPAAGPKPTVTLSREFGCEAYPVAERLKEILREETGDEWAIADKALLGEVARNHSVSEDVLQSLGTRPKFLDALLSTLTPSWRSEKDHHRLLAEHVVSMAARGNVIIVGMGGAILTQELENCRHFRLYASRRFKVASIARRMRLSSGEAETIIDRQQSQRDRFIRDFLDKDARDLSFYHLVFNNDRNGTETIARTIAGYLPKPAKG